MTKRRTITVNLDVVTVEREFVVIHEYGDTSLRVRLTASPWQVEHLAEKCVEWLRIRRNEAALKIRAVAAECEK